ncbi:MAG TPA: NAD(P)/FAD-dependent oxidoreductase [Acidimicrobiales bacterium]|nr:NAD(P)/FAD-dependent oxidoreductase [Acidimicrobiales bacterium]
MVLNVAIIGAGFGGIGAGVRLERARIANVAIFERASQLGGTWRDNTYPGCRCDVSSNLYSFSFAPNPTWTNTFSYQPEILQYLGEVTRRHRIDELIRYDHDVREVAYDEQARLWTLDTSQGTYYARAVILAVGALAEPRMPAIAGLNDFEGQLLHTARWDSSIKLSAERVGVIGTGASAIQVIPELAPHVERLEVFQRTPAWVIPHRGRAVRTRTRRLFRHVPLVQRLARYLDYWRRELLVLAFARQPARMAKAEDEARQFIAAHIEDPELRRRLTPDYRMGCKRVLLSNDYYPALARPNVEVVSDPIAWVAPNGIVTDDGRLHELDVLICATGFLVTDNPVCERVRAVDGRTLAEAFNGELAHYKGTTFPGFPNLFMLAGPNTGLGHSSIIFMIESQLNYVVRALEHALASDTPVEPTARAAASWTESLHAKFPRTVWGSGCASWYLNDAGRNTTIWPGFTFAFRRATRHFVRDDHAPTGERA